MTILKFTEEALKKICKANNYNIPSNVEYVFFGIRGLSPLDEKDIAFHQTQAIKITPVNYQTMNCTIGQWDIKNKKIAIFAGSTVPHITSVQAAKNRLGMGANQLMKGLWSFVKGTHYPRPSTAHIAFVQGMPFKIQRTSDDLDYDIKDPVSIGIVWDNLHCAWSGSTDYYSSAGCQVVAGMPKCLNNAIESGPWKTFRENAYKLKQTNFPYILFDSEDLKKALV